MPGPFFRLRCQIQVSFPVNNREASAAQSSNSHIGIAPFAMTKAALAALAQPGQLSPALAKDPKLPEAALELLLVLIEGKDRFHRRRQFVQPTTMGELIGRVDEEQQTRINRGHVAYSPYVHDRSMLPGKRAHLPATDALFGAQPVLPREPSDDDKRSYRQKRKRLAHQRHAAVMEHMCTWPGLHGLPGLLFLDIPARRYRQIKEAEACLIGYAGHGLHHVKEDFRGLHGLLVLCDFSYTKLQHATAERDDLYTHSLTPGIKGKREILLQAIADIMGIEIDLNISVEMPRSHTPRVDKLLASDPGWDPLDADSGPPATRPTTDQDLFMHYTHALRLRDYEVLKEQWEHALYKLSNHNMRLYKQMWEEVAAHTEVVTHWHRSETVVLREGRAVFNRLFDEHGGIYDHENYESPADEHCGETVTRINDDGEQQEHYCRLGHPDIDGSGFPCLLKSSKRKRLRMRINGRVWDCEKFFTYNKRKRGPAAWTPTPFMEGVRAEAARERRTQLQARLEQQALGLWHC